MTDMTEGAVMTVATRSARGVTVRFAEAGVPDGDIVLLLSPWPESLYAWQTMWPTLAHAARLIAIDLPGFGHSEPRDTLASPEAMGSFLIDLIDEWELPRLHIVGPDVGTGATLFAASLAPDRLSSAIVGSGATAWPLDIAGALKEIVDAPSLDALRQTDGRDVVAQALTGLEHHVLTDTAREDYLSAYAGTKFAESARYVRRYPDDLPKLASRLADVSTPVLIIAGRHDAFVPPSNATYLDERLPHSALVLLDTGHFTWEDGADEYEDLLTKWIAGRYRETAGEPL